MLEKSVRLEVAFVDHPQAVFVAQLDETGMGRIVTGSHRVDVVLLHEPHVLHHHSLVQGTSPVRVEFVPIDPTEKDPPAVHGEDAIHYGNPPKTDTQGDALTFCSQLAHVQSG